MADTVKKYQPQRIDILWNTDWGLPKDGLSLEEAQAREMVLFKDRWVTEDEYKTLASQEKAYKNIRFVGISFTVLGIILFLPAGATIIGIAVLYYLFQTGKSLRNYTGGLYAATGWLAFLLIGWGIALFETVGSDSLKGGKTAAILLFCFFIVWCVIALVKLWSVPAVRTILDLPPTYQPDEKTLRLLDKKDLLLLQDITSGQMSKEDVLARHKLDKARHHLDEAKLVEKCREFLKIGAISQHQHDSFLNGDYRLVVCEPIHHPTPAKEKPAQTAETEPRRAANPGPDRGASPNATKANNPGKKINAKQIVADIESGMDDVALMQKYGLSAKQMASLYEKLTAKGLLRQ